jgi:hypothetical protein
LSSNLAGSQGEEYLQFAPVILAGPALHLLLLVTAHG